MQIELFPTPAEAAESRVKDRAAAVVDVLRASTTIVTALSHGADRVIPLATVEEAKGLHATFPRGTALLCGERDGLKIDGFDLGNSPAEYGSAVVKGRALLFASTNGSPLMARADGAREKVVAAFVNLSAAAEVLWRTGADVAILCAGKLGRLSLEDFVCGGALADAVAGRAGGSVEMNDAAWAARRLWRDLYHGRVRQLLRDASHGRYLVSLGFESDLDLCARMDAIPIVPSVKEGRIGAPVRSG